MRLTNLVFYFLVLCTSSLILSSCEQYKIEAFESPDEALVSSINEEQMQEDSSRNLIQSTAARGETWQSWEDAFKSCFKNETFKDAVYLGPSSNKYLGTILSKNKSMTRTDLVNFVSIGEFKNFADEGKTVNTCDLTKIKDFSFNFFFGAVTAQMNDSLSTAITKYDSTKITGGQWRIDELRTSDFINFINDSDDKKFKQYRKTLVSDGNVVITKVIKVNGFTGEIYTSKDISAGVAAELQKGKELDISTSDTTSATPNFKLKLTLDNTKKNTVKVSSTGEFYIFAMVRKGKKVK